MKIGMVVGERCKTSEEAEALEAYNLGPCRSSFETRMTLRGRNA